MNHLNRERLVAKMFSDPNCRMMPSWLGRSFCRNCRNHSDVEL